jgi:hypothetical protein
MLYLDRVIKLLLALAVAALVVNDVARLVFPALQQVVVQSILEDAGKDENNPTTSTLFEEEVKHKDLRERLESLLPIPTPGLDAAITHLIKDDEVRHLAFIAIFSPPPDLG